MESLGLSAAAPDEVTLVELKDIQLPDRMKRAMAKQAEREKRAKIINAEGEALAAAALSKASDTMMAHPGRGEGQAPARLRARAGLDAHDCIPLIVPARPPGVPYLIQ